MVIDKVRHRKQLYSGSCGGLPVLLGNIHIWFYVDLSLMMSCPLPVMLLALMAYGSSVAPLCIVHNTCHTC